MVALSFTLALPSCVSAAEDEAVPVLTAEKAAAAKQQADVKSVATPAKPRVKPKPNTNVARRNDAGRLVADRPVYEFGQVDPKQRVKGSFVLTNAGKEMLEIKKPIKTGCGCTKPTLAKYKLEPGESVDMEVAFTAGAKVGKTKKNIWVTTLPPAQPAKLTLSITADVRKNIEHTPAKWQFELHDSKQDLLPLVLKSVDGQPFAVERYTSTEDAVKLVFDPNNRAAEHTLPIEVDRNIIKRVHNGVLTVVIDHPKVKVAKVPFETVLPFASEPPSLFLRNLVPGQERTGNIVIVSNYGQDFEIGEVKTLKGQVKLDKITKRQDGYRIDVTVNPPDESKIKMIRDQLIIEIKDHPDYPVTVSCTGVPRREKKAPAARSTRPPAKKPTPK